MAPLETLGEWGSGGVAMRLGMPLSDTFPKCTACILSAKLVLLTLFKKKKIS